MGTLVLGYDDSPSAASSAAVDQWKYFGDQLLTVFGDEPLGRVAGELGARPIADGTEVVLETAARERNARLIVIATYGEGPFRSAILGSTPHKRKRRNLR